MPIHTLLFVAYIVGATLFAFTSWRSGPFLIVLAAALQDPIRKTTPEAPAWLILGVAPIFAAWTIGMISRHPGWWSEFRWREPRLARGVEIFGAGLIIPVLIDLQYGIGGIKLIVMGMLLYGVVIANLVLGFYYGGDLGVVRRLFRWHVLVTAVMLVGVVLEYRSVFPDWYALGTKAMGNVWIRYIPGYNVRMISGFYRSPDIMGWHATTAALLAMLLALTSRSFLPRLAWTAISGWALVGTFLCGRRKFFYMIPLFLLAMTWLSLRRRGSGAAKFAALGVVSMGLFYGIYAAVGPYEDVAVYYFRTMGDTAQRAKDFGIWEVVSTFQQSGYLGQGLGSAATGAHRLETSDDRPRTWQEGGLGRLAVELGLPGLLCAFWLAYVLLVRLQAQARTSGASGGASGDLYLGVYALILANGTSFVISGQIFGEPFVGFFFSLLLGIALASTRLAAPAFQPVALPRRSEVPGPQAAELGGG
jgi:hypothetical protein